MSLKTSATEELLYPTYLNYHPHLLPRSSIPAEIHTSHYLEKPY